MDPLVFEEVVLSALELAGAFVVRNRRYSGDGGSDGRFWLPRLGWIALQMKRYGAHVSREDVAFFVRYVSLRQRFAAGWFVHTGRTGPACYAELRGSPVVLMSGGRILELLVDGRLPAKGGVSVVRFPRDARHLGRGREDEPGGPTSGARALPARRSDPRSESA